MERLSKYHFHANGQNQFPTSVFFGYKEVEFPFWKHLKAANVSDDLLYFFRDVFAENMRDRLRSFDDIKNDLYMMQDHVRVHFVTA